MALQGSGTISMSQINTELQRSSTANISLDSAENGSYVAINSCSTYKPSSSNPASMSEWYNYNHTQACCTAYGTYLYSTCGVFCLDGDTLVNMADGTKKKISEIVVGDMVESRDIVGMPDESPNQEHLTVQITSLNYTYSTATVKSLIRKTAEYYYNINNGLLLTTASHEHFIYRRGVWRISTTENLQVDDYFLKGDGTLERIVSVIRVQEIREFYNIDVENLDMYIANGIVTHNAKGTINTCNRYYWYADGSCGSYYVDQGLDCNCGGGCCQTYDYYYADRYDCNDCIYIESILVALPAGTSVNYGKFYNFYGGNDGYVYSITNTASSGIAYILSPTSYNSCSFGCVIMA